MNSATCMLAVAVSLLFASAVTARAAAGDPPASSLDLDAIKPKSGSTSSGGPGGIAPIGQSPLLKQKMSKGTSGSAVKTTVGTAIKSPLGLKGVLGGPTAGGKSAQPTPDDTASSNDVVVRLPSNMKK